MARCLVEMPGVREAAGSWPWKPLCSAGWTQNEKAARRGGPKAALDWYLCPQQSDRFGPRKLWEESVKTDFAVPGPAQG